jgi:hypothetical protein
MPPNEKFSSAYVDISFIAALYHPLFIAVENRAVSITGMKLWYCLHRSRSSVYTVYVINHINHTIGKAQSDLLLPTPSVGHNFSCNELQFVPEVLKHLKGTVQQDFFTNL